MDKLIDQKADVDERTMQMLVLGLEYLRELVDEHMRVETVEKRKELNAEVCASQKVHGLVNACTLILGDAADVRKVAEGYVGPQFIESMDDALDAICELINVANGKFARGFTKEGEDEDLEPPFYRHEASLVKADEIYAARVHLCDATVYFCIAYGVGIAAL